MSVTAPSHPPRPGDPGDQDEVEALVNALIEEARRRAWRRRLLYAAAVNAEGTKQRNLTRDIGQQVSGIAWMPT